MVNHNVLFDKLMKYDIPNCFLSWLGSYPKGRQQRVRVNQCLSSWRPLMGGMPLPQGSWLGTLSFLVLNDDLTAGCPIVKHADDTTLSETFQSKSYQSNMMAFLSNVLAWSVHGVEYHQNQRNDSWSYKQNWITTAYSVLGKIIFKTIWNQNQNHGLKSDFKSKSKSPLPKRFQIKIIFKIVILCKVGLC